MTRTELFNQTEMTACMNEFHSSIGQSLKGQKIMLLCLDTKDLLFASEWKKTFEESGANVNFVNPKTLLPGRTSSLDGIGYDVASCCVVVASEFHEKGNRPSSQNQIILDLMMHVFKQGNETYKMVALFPNQKRESYGFLEQVRGGKVKIGALNAGKDFAQKIKEAMLPD